MNRDAAAAAPPTRRATAPPAPARPAYPIGAAPALLSAYLLSQRVLAPSPRELSASQAALRLACSRLTQGGTHVELLATTYLPDQQRWLGLCIAPSESAVREAAATAQLTDVTVTEV